MSRNRRPRPLTAARVRTEKRPGRYHDGQGLYLQVDASGARRWLQRVVIRGKRTDLGLGGWPLVSLAEAREKALANRKLAREGGDPRGERRRDAMPSFAEAAETVIEFNRPTWRNAKHAAQWSSTLRTYAYPHFGDAPVDEVTGADVMRALSPIWTVKPETARRVRQRIGAVMKWAIANEYRHDNPAGDAVEAALPRTPRVKAHMAALPYAEVPAVLRSIRESSAKSVTKLALEYLILTAARSGEVRAAVWEEIDPASHIWTVPAARMKAGREHRVPLSKRATGVLDEARSFDVGSDLIFPSAKGKPLSDMAMTVLLRRLGVPCVPHGFRSSFRDWAAEQTDAPHAVMEAALAHTVRSSVEAAYFRSDLFEKRRGLMDRWAEFLGGKG